ncbi:MAG: T9SS type A sorting domain-containing protein [Bacteroidetes bacterium]|nr:T9SS type A sorting domain-containing protein [Bacteroidota bacterium]
MCDVRLFPNPTNDFVNIAVDEAMVKSKLTITDITGRKITVAQIENRISKHRLTLAAFTLL